MIFRIYSDTEQLFLCFLQNFFHQQHLLSFLQEPVVDASGGCSPVNCLSQTRRNLAIEFLGLNFSSRRKLCKNSVFYEYMNIVPLILFGKVFIFLRFCSFPFGKCIPLPSLSDIGILGDSVLDLKISTRSVTIDSFNWLRRNSFLA